jgi:NAD(P)-dependent dehydrogenase (short-subunit alcohol dehydrogenase family)
LSGKVIVVADASSGLGWASAAALALAGNTVYASLRDVTGRNAARVETAAQFAKDNGVELRTVEMDVQSTASVNAAVDRIFNANGRIDVVVQNTARTSFGPAEAFTAAQLAEQFDVNVVSTQRMNRAVLPHMRRRRCGLLVWVSCTTPAGGTPPYLAPYFAAKAAMDSLAVGYARELTRWGIETSIIAATVTGDHIAQAGTPTDRAVVLDYEEGLCAGVAAQVRGVFATSAAVQAPKVVEALVGVVDAPFGKRPFHVHIDGADVGSGVRS